MTLRFQPLGPRRYDTFAEVEVAPQVGKEDCGGP